MAGKNGTGPLGQGPGSGRGWGFCSERDAGSDAPRLSRRRAAGAGFGQGRGVNCRRVGEGAGLRNEISRLENLLAGLKRRQDKDE
ncbi:DUF5320 domain-containing protein [Geoalkalibacter halelectricus]|uniref:DUF5320 domain-containing protein n=1 Tax=Geoalkalibacter halelectricus TaxID=2847045 RepID=UPI003D1FEE36